MLEAIRVALGITAQRREWGEVGLERDQPNLEIVPFGDELHLIERCDHTVDLTQPLTEIHPRSRQVILEALRARAEAGAVVLFSTHVLHEVEALTDRVMLIARGQLVAQGEVSEIRDLLHEHPHSIHVRCERPREFASLVLRADASIASVQLHPDAVTFRTATPDQTYMQVAEVALANGHPIESITSPDATLEALFHYLVERGSAGAGTGSDAAVGSAKAVGP